ncbi:hypothetical protein BST81_17210 [Leptolyngbya sp. 'hensonii']|nr:hypothetical protein BST81_17210 [Leptolyngbya sp. 'hensonii']
MGNLNHIEETPLILIADDDETIRVLLRRVMEQEGYRVAEASDGTTCLESFARLQPNIILLDARMPGIDGFSCCLQLQSLPGGDRTPILIVTSLEDRASVDQAFQAGASDFITKPIQIAVLRHRVRRLLKTGKVVDELRRQTEREQLLRTLLLRQMRESPSLDEVLNTTVSEVRHFLEADRVVIYKFSYSKDAVVVSEAVQPMLPSLQQTIAYANWFAEKRELYNRGHVVSTPDLNQADLPLSMIKFLQQAQVQAALEVPILLEDSLWGLLVAHQCTQPRQWFPFEIDALEQLAGQVALTIRHTILYENLHKLTQRLHLLATLDGLTQLANRRRFNEYLQQEWRRGAREQTHLSLILCDIDFFKGYNDSYGHQAGDECLKQVALAISQATRRPADLVARYGGEEFAVILPNTSVEGALYVAEEIRIKVKALGIQHDTSSVDRSITLSLGVAGIVPHHDTSPVTLITAADQALYRAKLEGRDRVVLQAHAEI